MNNVISISEVVESWDQEGSVIEVVATADARFDDARSEVVTQVGSFVRPVDVRHKEQHLATEWLPAAETVREKVSRAEAAPMAKEIFRRWVRKVRQAIPSLANR